ncbi:MAG: NAD-dependent deacylase [Anaerolineales bacterium]
MEFPAHLLALLRQAERIAVLTGAGISQESGLRTFRDAQNGLWQQYRPEELASPQAFARNPKLVWDWYAYRREALKGARPNPAHYALVEMERHAPDFTLITQNVDGLHQMAGSRSVIELHGNIRRVRCSLCEAVASDWEDDGLEVPRCVHCGGLLRPDVVWFGEMLPRQALEAAIAAARRAQIFFSIGTSGVVQPAASLPYAAKRNGAVVIEINLEETPLTPRADFAFQGKAGQVLPALVTAAWG